MTHCPMTKDQRETLDRDLSTIIERLEDIATLLRACYGEKDPQVWRARVARAAVERLLWLVERETQSAMSVSAA